MMDYPFLNPSIILLMMNIPTVQNSAKNNPVMIRFCCEANAPETNAAAAGLM